MPAPRTPSHRTPSPRTPAATGASVRRGAARSALGLGATALLVAVGAPGAVAAVPPIPTDVVEAPPPAATPAGAPLPDDAGPGPDDEAALQPAAPRTVDGWTVFVEATCVDAAGDVDPYGEPAGLLTWVEVDQVTYTLDGAPLPAAEVVVDEDGFHLRTALLRGQGTYAVSAAAADDVTLGTPGRYVARTVVDDSACLPDPLTAAPAPSPTSPVATPSAVPSTPDDLPTQAAPEGAPAGQASPGSPGPVLPGRREALRGDASGTETEADDPTGRTPGPTAPSTHSPAHVVRVTRTSSPAPGTATSSVSAADDVATPAAGTAPVRTLTTPPTAEAVATQPAAASTGGGVSTPAAAGLAVVAAGGALATRRWRRRLR